MTFAYPLITIDAVDNGFLECALLARQWEPACGSTHRTRSEFQGVVSFATHVPISMIPPHASYDTDNLALNSSFRAFV